MADVSQKKSAFKKFQAEYSPFLLIDSGSYWIFVSFSQLHSLDAKIKSADASCLGKTIRIFNLLCAALLIAAGVCLFVLETDIKITQIVCSVYVM